MSQQVCSYCNARFASAAPGSSCKGRCGGGLLSGLFKCLLLYVGLVFAGGTLIQTGHPVAVESGRLIHTIAFIEPATHWLQTHGYGAVAYGVQAIADGMRFS